jgi:hypothetical protein
VKFGERGKSSGRHWWVQRCSRGFLLGFDQGLTKVDQKGSLGFVGDVFEVMAQVDRRLTKVNVVDLLIRVNNSGSKLGASH